MHQDIFVHLVCSFLGKCFISQTGNWHLSQVQRCANNNLLWGRTQKKSQMFSSKRIRQREISNDIRVFSHFIYLSIFYYYFFFFAGLRSVYKRFLFDSLILFFSFIISFILLLVGWLVGFLFVVLRHVSTLNWRFFTKILVTAKLLMPQGFN